MKFRLKLGPFELALETEQMSPVDMMAALWSVQAQMMGDTCMVHSGDDEE
ncbi:hypothetical protein IU449_27185 [Nocardia higoensis]|uniref:Uncharacterized protein n=1 Tax=Nocardia higoensis TaxID=228599 RepID=A0ABS0DIA7_9NOCA|nr:hypothetical protein [Nocardia higoensis]MBF6358185.1 hypothetical protein [Nocardia higoensis]